MNAKSAIVAALVVVLAAVLVAPAFADGISREQGDAMLNELRQIRQLLEKQQKPAQAAPAAPAAAEPVRLKLGREVSLGREDAPLVLVEYTDYQCPFCARFYTTTFAEIKKQYIDTGKMRFISRDYPLDFHPHALKAAQATRCAGEQGKFWQMKESLMVNHARLAPEVITTLARDAAVDMTKFQACMDQGKYLPEIKEGMSAAQAAGINGTPSFVLGKVVGEHVEGNRIVGAQPLAAFESAMREVLARDKK